MNTMKKYAAIFHFTPHLPHQVLIRAENEEQAVMTVYYAAWKTFSWPKGPVTLTGLWTEGDIPGSVTDRLKQKRKEKKYSVPYEYIEKNLFKIKCRKGKIVDHGIMSRLTARENMERIQKKAEMGLL